MAKTEQELANAQDVPYPSIAQSNESILTLLDVQPRRRHPPRTSPSNSRSNLLPPSTYARCPDPSPEHHAGTLLYHSTHLRRRLPIHVSPTTHGPSHPRMGRIAPPRPRSSRKLPLPHQRQSQTRQHRCYHKQPTKPPFPTRPPTRERLPLPSNRLRQQQHPAPKPCKQLHPDSLQSAPQ